MSDCVQNGTPEQVAAEEAMSINALMNKKVVGPDGCNYLVGTQRRLPERSVSIHPQVTRTMSGTSQVQQDFGESTRPKRNPLMESHAGVRPERNDENFGKSTRPE
jgi:hypothetical protein